MMQVSAVSWIKELSTELATSILCQGQKHGQQLATVGGTIKPMWKATQEETTLATS